MPVIDLGTAKPRDRQAIAQAAQSGQPGELLVKYGLAQDIAAARKVLARKR